MTVNVPVFLHFHLQPAIKGLSTREEQLLTATTIQADLEFRLNSIKVS